MAAKKKPPSRKPSRKTKPKGKPKKGTLFGKPRDQVIKRPGAFRAKAKAAGKSTSALAREKAGENSRTGRQARLALAFAKMRKKKKG